MKQALVKSHSIHTNGRCCAARPEEHPHAHAHASSLLHPNTLPKSGTCMEQSITLGNVLRPNKIPHDLPGREALEGGGAVRVAPMEAMHHKRKHHRGVHPTFNMYCETPSTPRIPDPPWSKWSKPLPFGQFRYVFLIVDSGGMSHLSDCDGIVCQAGSTQPEWRQQLWQRVGWMSHMAASGWVPKQKSIPQIGDHFWAHSHHLLTCRTRAGWCIMGMEEIGSWNGEISNAAEDGLKVIAGAASALSGAGDGLQNDTPGNASSFEDTTTKHGCSGLACVDNKVDDQQLLSSWGFGCFGGHLWVWWGWNVRALQ